MRAVLLRSGTFVDMTYMAEQQTRKDAILRNRKASKLVNTSGKRVTIVDLHEERKDSEIKMIGNDKNLLSYEVEPL